MWSVWPIEQPNSCSSTAELLLPAISGWAASQHTKPRHGLVCNNMLIHKLQTLHKAAMNPSVPCCPCKETPPVPLPAGASDTLAVGKNSPVHLLSLLPNLNADSAPPHPQCQDLLTHQQLSRCCCSTPTQLQCPCQSSIPRTAAQPSTYRPISAPASRQSLVPVNPHTPAAHPPRRRLLLHLQASPSLSQPHPHQPTD